MSGKEKPQIRRVSKTLRVRATVRDYKDGVPFEQETVVEVRAEEWLNRRTGRYGRRYAAREETRLGWDTGVSARATIVAAVWPIPRRGGWLADAVRKAEALTYREER
jgi:hypothetical protein